MLFFVDVHAYVIHNVHGILPSPILKQAVRPGFSFFRRESLTTDFRSLTGPTAYESARDPYQHYLQQYAEQK